MNRLITAALVVVIFAGGLLSGYWIRAANADTIITGCVSDMNRLLPAFFCNDIKEGLTGTIRLKVAYDKEKVSSVTVVSTDLQTRTDHARRFPKLVELSRDRIVRTVEEWDTYFVSPFESEVTITLRLDGSLSGTARAYRVETGEHGEITSLEMIGPDVQKLK
ncbi:MAG: hypothetical protein EHM23_30150 [Acidobacteria bacterium]|nr:MAG: hypothetical protein EHM23_30150 [Acidobacteriota bacterium]